MKKIKITTLLIIVGFLLLVPPALELANVWSQVPPPQLPGAPDQSLLLGSGLAGIIALFYGSWRLYKNK